MSRSNRSAFVAAFLILGALADTDAQAQMGGGMRRGSGEQRGGRTVESTAVQPARPSLADRLDQVGAQLLLTREQGRAWDAFRAAFMALQRPANGAVAMSDTLSAARAMQQKLSQAQDQYTLVEAMSDALKALEGQLDARQRESEDKLLPALLAEFVRTGGARERAP